MPLQPNPFGNALEAEKRLRRLRAAFQAVSRRYERSVQRRGPANLISLVIIGAALGVTLGLLLIRLEPLILH